MGDFCWKDPPTTLQHFRENEFVLGGAVALYSLYFRSSLEIHHRKWAGHFALEAGYAYSYSICLYTP